MTIRIARVLLLLFALAAVPAFAQQQKKKGKVTTYYQNGKKESSGKVKNYKKQGTWKYWEADGRLMKTVQYKDDIAEGAYTEYFHDGTVALQGTYGSGGMKTGTWMAYYQGGKKSYVLHYSMNNFDGEQNWWYENGQLREQTMYANGKIVYRRTWYYNGRKKATESYSDGLADGTWRTYPSPTETSDTLPKSIDTYAGGKRNGVHIGFANGKRNEEYYFKDDKLDGSFQKWDDHGFLGVSENYKDGKLDGVCKYFDKGKLMREVKYSQGKIDGAEKEYYYGSSLTKMSWYRNGVLDSAYTYYRNGKVETTRIYKYYPGFVKTEEFSFYSEYDSTGVLLQQGEFHFETRDHYWTTYYPNGKMKSQTPYSNGRIVGTYRKWYMNGKPLIEMDCDGQNATAAPKIWDEKGKPLKPNTKQYQELLDSSRPGEIYNDPNKYKTNRTALPSSNETVVETAPPVMDEPQMIENSDPPVIEPQQEIDQPRQPEIFQFAEEMPDFPGGNDSFKKYINDNLRYPQDAKEANKQGTVYVSFVVRTDGSVTDVRVARGVSGAPSLDKEAVRLISESPKWKPGRMNGRAVNVQMTMPVKFTLQ